VVNAKKQVQLEKGTQIYNELRKKGYTVLLDDRNERAGVKFNDAELIGLPIRITVGRDAEENLVEMVERKTADTVKISTDDIEENIIKIFEKQGYNF